MVTISEAGKVLTQLDWEREDLDKQALALTSEMNQILQTAFEAVKKIGQKQEAIIQRRIGLEQLAFRTITMNLEK